MPRFAGLALGAEQILGRMQRQEAARETLGAGLLGKIMGRQIQRQWPTPVEEAQLGTIGRQVATTRFSLRRQALTEARRRLSESTGPYGLTMKLMEGIKEKDVLDLADKIEKEWSKRFYEWEPPVREITDDTDPLGIR